MGEEDERCLLESNSSFVPATTTTTAAAAASSSVSCSTSTNHGFQGKRVMTYEQLQATGALTPVRRDSRPASSGGSGKHNGNPAPFASPVTKRTQRAAAKLAERRQTISPKEMESTSTLTPPAAAGVSPMTTSSNANAATDLASDFGQEKEGGKSKVARSNSSNKPKATTSCFASPPLSGAASAGRRRFAATSTRSMASPSTADDGNGGGGVRTPLKTLPLSVQREMERKKEARALAASKADTGPNFDSRRNLDKRTVRLRYSGDFAADLAKHRATSLTSPLPAKESRARTDTSAVSTTADAAAPSSSSCNGVEIFVRKRPIFQYELARGEFDVVEIDSSNDNEESSGGDVDAGGEDVVVINNCVIHADMRRKLVKPTYFPCTKAFDENTTQDEIYSRVAQPMVQNAARGGISTIAMFGQTGSGKTFTMAGIEERAATGIFDELANAGHSDAVISVQFVELAGKTCKDLLGDDGLEVTLAEAKDGSVKLIDAASVEVKTPQELAKAIELGKSRRKTEATDVNGVSSRSHAVVQIHITFGRKAQGDNNVKTKQRRGLLNLLDLAGSERKNDSMYHSSERQKESNEINASLWALKECTRTRALASMGGKKKETKVIIPYRSNNLTRLLRETFERDSARLSVIATVAPNATDTEHSMETLRFVSQLVGSMKDIREDPARDVVSIVAEMKKVEASPKVYSHAQLCAFLKKKKIDATLPKNVDGKALMKMSSAQIRSRMKISADASSEIFNALRKENDRVAKLQRAERLRVSQARKEGSGHA